MARALHILTARKVAALKTVGRHSDGGGLYLRVTPSGGRSWVFMSTIRCKRIEIGLGAETSVTLAAARQVAAKMREAVALGNDPRSVLKVVAAEPAAGEAITFGKFADAFISDVESGWKNPIHRRQWRQSLRDHATALTHRPIAEVNTDDILGVLKPIWLKLPETAGRVRGRIERILAAAKARGIRSRDAGNPAQLKGHLDVLLPKQPRMVRGHHKALSFADAPTFMAALRKRRTDVARCLEFTVLTAARSGEALGATWNEIDFTTKIWRVPGARMKAGADHTVPLSTAALTILEALKPDELEAKRPIFAVDGAQRSNMAMSMLLRRMEYGHVTVHGFRSTFRDWAGDATAYPREIIEAALAHTIQNKAERAYRRGTAIERRRELMEDWAKYLADKTASTSDHSATKVDRTLATEPVSIAHNKAVHAKTPRLRKQNPAQVVLFEDN